MRKFLDFTGSLQLFAEPQRSELSVADLICCRPIFSPEADLTAQLNQLMDSVQRPTMIALHLGESIWRPINFGELPSPKHPVFLVEERSEMIRKIRLYESIRRTTLVAGDTVILGSPLGFPILEPEIRQEGSVLFLPSGRRYAGVQGATRFGRWIGTLIRA